MTMLLEIRGLNTYYGESHILRDVDLTVKKGEMVCLIGRNGVGKTTLFRMIDGQVETDAGERKIKPGTRIVVLEQDPDLTGHATLMVNVLDDEARYGAAAPTVYDAEDVQSRTARRRRVWTPATPRG